MASMNDAFGVRQLLLLFLNQCSKTGQNAMSHENERFTSISAFEDQSSLLQRGPFGERGTNKP